MAEPAYLPEHIYNTERRRSDLLTNVAIAFHAWPDCTSLESAISDIFRLEGVIDKEDQERALALWKWFRILVSATGGSYAYERGGELRDGLVTDPHKIFAVYGHHQCDGLSWAMTALWRAAGYVAFDQCHTGHTIASLYYRDADGELRFHDFDPQGRFYYWDKQNRRVGTWTMPILRGRVHRHLMMPRHIHSLHTSLTVGETRERKWDNTGHLVPSGKDKLAALQNDPYYRYKPAKTGGVYAVAGEEVHRLSISPSPEFMRQTDEDSVNVACSEALLHPREPGKTAVLVYRMNPPYVVADAEVEATLLKGTREDLCRLSISSDGKQWQPIFEKVSPGEETVRTNIGFDAWQHKRPNVYTEYMFYVKVELSSQRDVRKVGMRRMNITAWRMLNKRTLPTLRPGPNWVKVTADHLEPGYALKLRIAYSIKGESHIEERLIRALPHYFCITVPDADLKVLKNYDQDWNTGEIRMTAITLSLVPAADLTNWSVSEPEQVALAAFRQSAPHPADMTNHKLCKVSETDIRQTNGFFPQAGPGSRDDEQKMKELLVVLDWGRPAADPRPQWLAAEDLGDYPRAMDALLEILPQANIDLTVFICKALARHPDRKMIGPLLAKWREAPAGAPGTRYIPDVLAAIGDRSVVPDLIRPLKHCRFDYRFHIARALRILGGPEAEKVLEDLAANDPLRAVREEAREGVERLRKAR
ncbi:MAG: HEAT repeat domain-containing protein [Kiritimatiellia bacterium]